MRRPAADFGGPHELGGHTAAAARFRFDHPEAFRRLDRLDQEIAEAAYELDLDRLDLDGIAPTPPLPARRLQWEPARLEEAVDFGLDL